jgi:hypothetical protein
VSTLMDHRLGLKAETTYGTPVTVNRFYPYLDVKSEWDPRPRQGKGITSGGRRGHLASRRFLPNGQGSITTKIELESKNAGVILDAAFGASTVTTITGGAQMNFTPLTTGTLLGSYTIQVVKVQNEGTDFVETYAGCTASKFTIEQPEDDIPTLEVEWDALSYTTATGAASASYASAPTIFDASQATVGYASTLTVPTTTALATGLTAITSFRSWKLDVDNKIDTGRWNLNAARTQPAMGMPEYKFSAKVEHNATTIPAAMAAGTQSPWYTTYTTTEAISSGFAQLQVVAPKVAIEKANIEAKIGDLTMINLDATLTNDGTNKDLYVAYRTTDTAL